MGPRALARGNSPAPVGHPPPGAASMGPRALARGNLVRRLRIMASLACFNGAARSRARKSKSTRPPRAGASSFNGAARSRARKYRDDEGHYLVATKLQWGRALSRAEISAGVVVPSVICWLQWGRALSRAEIRPSADTFTDFSQL